MAPGQNPSRRREMLIQLLRAGGLGAGAVGLGVGLRGRSRRPEEAAAVAVRPRAAVPVDPVLPQMAIAQGDDPRLLVRRAVGELGGMRRFVSAGEVVVVKPNIGWDRTPAQAANTNPDVVGEVVRLCLEAGAGKVIVTDVPVNEPRRAFLRSGIAEAARREGAEIVLPEERGFKDADLGGEVLGVWSVLEPFLEADKIINLPIAKHHSLTGATLGMKNWYGVLGGERQRLHQRIHESLADLAAFLRPALTILDAYRVLVRNGPAGGSPEDVETKKTLIAGTDPVALDAYVAKAYWDLDAERLPYLEFASRRGLGTVKFETLRVRRVTL
ncbi:MAG: DUF362 domain-containing protein [Bryobacterales bacterium]|nr:DUF362 domain-containing protein [Bryobacterales bacterium]